jgi:ADP-dependent NAD(P)H-hydrate dehydratase / NAD(P)H-hydrate epimerase
MKIFTADQIRAWDKATIAKAYQHSSDLMEHAAGAVSNYLLENEPAMSFAIVCGTGNNGGDGLVIARKLHEEGKSVEVFIAGQSETGSEDFKLNLQRLLQSDIEVHFLPQDLTGFAFSKADRILDCILGTGISRSVEGYLAEVIHAVNYAQIPVIAIDLPSGLLPDLASPQTGAVVQASQTITFEAPKMAMLFPENELYVGQITVIPIGLDADFLNRENSSCLFIDDYDASAWLTKRPLQVYKNQLGHLQVIAGSYGKMGAAVLCAHAAIRSGCGLVTASVPVCGVDILQVSLPEVMCNADADQHFLHTTDLLENATAVAMGPGIGTFPETALMMRKLLRNIAVPCVYDADALNIIAEKRLIAELKPGSVITPHVGEFDRLFGKHESTFDRLQTMKEIAIRHQLVVVLKGPHTIVVDPSGTVSFNSSGNPGMATAGSGDTLTGIIGSLLAQRYDAAIAARLGVYIHGLAGDVAREENSTHGMIAGDIVNCLGDAFLHLESMRNMFF